MKKIISLLLSLAFVLTFFAVGCTPNVKPDEGDTKTPVTIAMPDGAPVLAVYELLKNSSKIDGHDVEYKILAGAANIGTSILSGEADVAVMPTNVAAKLYNNGAKIKMLSVNIFGVLYMVGKNPLTSGTSDLLGKVVLNIGRGGTPDITLKYILDSNNLPYVESETAVEGKVAIRYVNDASEVIAMLKTDKADYGIMGEPAVTNAVKAIPCSVVLDMQSAWNSGVGENSFTQVCVVLGESVYNDKAFVDDLYAKLTSNVSYLAEDLANIGATLQEKGSSLKVNFTQETLNRCNVQNKKAIEVKAQLENYFKAIYEYDKTFIGGKLPDENLYYNA